MCYDLGVRAIMGIASISPSGRGRSLCRLDPESQGLVLGFNVNRSVFSLGLTYISFLPLLQSTAVWTLEGDTRKSLSSLGCQEKNMVFGVRPTWV